MPITGSVEIDGRSRIGLVDHRLRDRDLAARMADKSPLGLRRMKQLVDDGLEQPQDVALRNERVMVEAHNLSHDRREGLEAFAQKRSPRFNGT